MSQPDVTLHLPYQEEHSRLTTFFRYPLALFPLLWAGLIGIAALLGTIAAWFILLVTGRYPEGLYALNRHFARYSAKCNGYFYLATDTFPGFGVDEPADYPVRLDVGPPLPAYDRMKVLFRIILAIPPYLIAYAMNIVATVGAILAWFVILFTGKLPHGIYGIIRLGLSYQVRVVPYFLLMTETWPPFTEEADVDALREPGTPAALGAASSGSDAAAAFGEPAAQDPPELPGGFEPPAPPPGG